MAVPTFDLVDVEVVSVLPWSPYKTEDGKEGMWSALFVLADGPDGEPTRIKLPERLRASIPNWKGNEIISIRCSMGAKALGRTGRAVLEFTFQEVIGKTKPAAAPAS